MDIQRILEQLDALFDTGKIAQVEGFLKNYIECAEAEGDYSTKLTLLNELIGYYREMTMHREAEGTATDILATIDRLGMRDTLAEATSLLNIATAYRFLGEYDKALTAYARVEELYDRLLPPEDMRIAGLHNNRSILYSMMNREDMASESLLAAIGIVRKNAGNEIKEAIMLTNLGQSYIMQNRMAEAEEKLLASVRIFKQTDSNDSHYCGCANALATLYYRQGKYRESVQYFEEALDNIERMVGKTDNYNLILQNLRMAKQAAGIAE